MKVGFKGVFITRTCFPDDCFQTARPHAKVLHLNFTPCEDIPDLKVIRIKNFFDWIFLKDEAKKK